MTDKMDVEEQYAIKPQAVTPAIDTSTWPLLLKNYSNLLVRTGHFTPIPNGSSPLKRDIKSYISYGFINLVGFPGAPRTRQLARHNISNLGVVC